MKHPNFFIVGAPKCGTTAMHTYLKQHPDVFMSSFKEPHHFGTDIVNPFYLRDRGQYLKLFEDATTESRVGESSVNYLYSRLAASEIKAAYPEALIIALLRNPIDMIHSQHNELYYQGKEPVADFEQAMALEAERAAGRHVPDVPNPATLLYRQTARFAEQLQRYFDEFGRDRVLVIIHDDMLADVRAVYRRTCEFLGVDPDFEPEFRIVNSNHVVKSYALRRLLKQPPQVVRTLVKTVLPHQPSRELIKLRLKRLNTIYKPRPPMRPELRRQLQQELLPDVIALSELLGRDLTHWCRPAGDERAKKATPQSRSA